MSLKNRTKRLLADTMERMLDDRTLKEIRVTDLCRQAGVEPGVFYYHFTDKYDLAAWIYKQDYEGVYGDFSEEVRWSYSRNVEHMQKHMGTLWERRDLYLKLFGDETMYSLRKYVLEYNESFMSQSARIGSGIKVLDQEAICVVKYASFGMFETMVDWLKGRLDLTPEEMGRYLYELTAQTLVGLHQRHYEYDGMRP